MPKTALAAVKSNAKTNGYADAGEVARKLSPPEPVFCFSRKQLEERLQLFQKGFPGEVSFAVKSNPRRTCFRPCRITASTTGMWPRFTRWKPYRASAAMRCFTITIRSNPAPRSRTPISSMAAAASPSIAVKSCARSPKLSPLRKTLKSPCALCCRASAPHRPTTSPRNSAPLITSAVELLKEAKERGFTPLLTFHPGSQSRDPLVYKRHIEAAARIARTAGVEITKLNVGGGFPANYQRSTGGPLGPFFAMIQASATLAFGKGKEPKLECEPGRGLVATSMSLLVRVKLVCTDGDDIFINDGVYGGLMEVMQVPELEPPYRVLRDGEVLHGETKSYKVFGPTCDPLDVLPHRMELPAAIRDEDYIEFGNLGAYGIATSTMFNGYGGHKVVDVDEVLAI